MSIESRNTRTTVSIVVLLLVSFLICNGECGPVQSDDENGINHHHNNQSKLTNNLLVNNLNKTYIQLVQFQHFYYSSSSDSSLRFARLHISHFLKYVLVTSWGH